MSDGILHMTLLGGAARAQAVYAPYTVTTARSLHNLSPTAAAALGRALMGTAMLSAMQKGEGHSLTLTLKGGGPLGQVVCVGYPDGRVKGYVDYPEADPPRKYQGKLDVGTAVGHDGYFTVIRDFGSGEPYIGRTPLVSGEVAEDIAQYLLTSEQAPSLVALGVLVRGEEVLGAGGLLIQTLPGCSEEDLQKIEALSGQLAHISALAGQAKDVGELASLCLGNTPYDALEKRDIAFSCGCDRARIEGVLLSLGEKELRDMIAEQNGAQLSCHFCGARYEFSAQELGRLIDNAKSP